MNKALDVCKHNELWSLIKRVSNYHGGDDVEELKAFAKEMVKNYTIDDCLACFLDLFRYCK